MRALALLAMLGCTPDPVLYVDLYTDFDPGEEVDVLHVEISADRVFLADFYEGLPYEPMYLDGYRVADEIEGLPAGTLSIHAELLHGGRLVLATNLTLFDFERQTVAPILITRACLGVVCPRDGDPPGATTCVGGGQCVPPECLGLESDPPECPRPECDGDDDCEGRGACGVGRCLREGRCGVELDSASCGAGMYCTAEGVCDRIEVPDAGVDDAGMACGVESCNGADDDCDTRVDETEGTDVANCGFCGVVCPDGANATPICASRTCDLACDARFGDCNGDLGDGCEQDLRTFVTGGCPDSCTIPHCGACNTPCALDNAWETCSDGTCRILSCRSPYESCDGDDSNGCETPANTLTDCGICGRLCDPQNAFGANCNFGGCTYTSCFAGFADCDGDATNGCERSLRTRSDCGACGRACGANATASCSTGTCTVSSCDSGYQNCNGDPYDGCEITPSTPYDCAACGIMCSAPNVQSYACYGMSLSCLVGTCRMGWCNSDLDHGNGCEAPC